MCFSAPASFVGSAVIGGIGAAAQKKVVQPKQRLFALIPLLFAVQQLAEGILWVTLASGAYPTLESIATYVFLVPALVLWPFIVSLSVYLMEKGKVRRKILVALLAMGGATSLFYVYCLIFHDVTAQIHGFHILYSEDFPRVWMNSFYPLYVIATIAPLLVSSVRRMWVFGILIAISYLTALIFFSRYLISVWCFFAAIMSVVIYWILVLANSSRQGEIPA